MSIDMPIAQADRNTGVTNFNYIDCYVEYVVEVVMKYDNAIPEPHTRHQKEPQQHRHFQVIYQLAKDLPVVNSATYESRHDVYFIHSDKHAYQFIKEINPPPPKFL
jgi:hypothetical protein